MAIVPAVEILGCILAQAPDSAPRSRAPRLAYDARQHSRQLRALVSPWPWPGAANPS
jgi:hypothetical protein